MTATVISPPPVPALVVGTVSHARSNPVHYAFQHAHYQWLVDLDALPRLPHPLRLLARFDAKDHLDRGRADGTIRGDLDRWLRARGVALDAQDRVLMLAHARVLGHVFDPLTVFWCLRPDGGLRAVVLEVHNTYGERHAYLLRPDERGAASVDKEFYVSPYNDISGRYDVTLRLTDRRVRVGVVLHRDGVPVLAAVTSGRALAATGPRILRTFLSHALMTHRVSCLIRWHGIRLWLARLPVRPRPDSSMEALR